MRIIKTAKLQKFAGSFSTTITIARYQSDPSETPFWYTTNGNPIEYKDQTDFMQNYLNKLLGNYPLEKPVPVKIEADYAVSRIDGTDPEFDDRTTRVYLNNRLMPQPFADLFSHEFRRELENEAIHAWESDNNRPAKFD